MCRSFYNEKGIKAKRTGTQGLQSPEHGLLRKFQVILHDWAIHQEAYHGGVHGDSRVNSREYQEREKHVKEDSIICAVHNSHILAKALVSRRRVARCDWMQTEACRWRHKCECGWGPSGKLSNDKILKNTQCIIIKSLVDFLPNTSFPKMRSSDSQHRLMW